MSNPETRDVTVTYRDSEPGEITVKTVRKNKSFTYTCVYGFLMEGTTAVLATIQPDGDKYPVQANDETRELARKAVAELPFVQGVVMFE